MNAMKEIIKHIQIFGLFIKNGLIAQMEYRLNFIIGILTESAFSIAKLLYVIVIYGAGVDINGLSPDQVLLFIGTYMLMTAIYTMFFMENFFQLSEHVRSGSLDMFLTKPVSVQFMATLRRVNFAYPIPNLLVGSAMVLTAKHRMALEVTPSALALYLLLIASGTLLMYALFLLPQLLTFFIVKTQSVIEIADKLWDFNNMPMLIYNKWIQRAGIFLLPIFVITNFPAMALLERLSGAYAAWGFIVPVLLFALTRKAWVFCLKRYSSASS